MNKKEQLQIIKKLDKDTIDLIQKKGKDYSNEDVLSNFKQVSGAVKSLGIDVGTQEGYALMMCILKIARITNLKAKGTTPENESLLDSYNDLINYAKLAYLCETENTKTNASN